MAKILVVDDDPDFVEITRMILETNGYHVISAANGEQALSKMRQDKPDLVILDVMMSYALEGLDVSREMRADEGLRDIPIIMVSSIASSPYAKMFSPNESLSVDAWISKPVQYDDLLKKIRQCLPKPAAGEDKAATRRATVLVIDDDPDFVEFVRIILKSEGYEVLTAERCDKGLTLMRQERPNVVLLDMLISYTFNGFNVIREIRNDPQLKEIPLILISAILTDKDLDIFPGNERLSAELFMSKPIDPEDLLKQVNKLILSADKRR
jgi:CheY-like chemotaxis protein